MSDRLSELRRQRALVTEQLAWLDREIVAAGNGTPAVAAPPMPPADPSGGVDPLAADKILAEFRDEAENSPTKMRRGCLGIFAAGMALLILGVFAIYWLRYR
jgi:CHASE3 domain sensor protein